MASSESPDEDGSATFSGICAGSQQASWSRRGEEGRLERPAIASRHDSTGQGRGRDWGLDSRSLAVPMEGEGELERNVRSAAEGGVGSSEPGLETTTSVVFSLGYWSYSSTSISFSASWTTVRSAMTTHRGARSATHVFHSERGPPVQPEGTCSKWGGER